MKCNYKITYFLTVLLLGVFLVLPACNKEDNGLSKKNTIMSLKCSFPSTENPQTRTQYVFEDNALKVSWSPGDEIAVSDGKTLFKFKQTGEITDNGHTALFICDSTISLNGDNIIAIYPYIENLSFDLSQQSGNLEDLSTNDIYIAKAKLFADNGPENLIFNPLCAIARFPKGTYLVDSDYSGPFQLNLLDPQNGNFASIITVNKNDGTINTNYYVDQNVSVKKITIPVDIDKGKLSKDYFLAFIPNQDKFSHSFAVSTDRYCSFNLTNKLSPNNVYTISSVKYFNVKAPTSLSLSKEKQTFDITLLTNRECIVNVSNNSWIKSDLYSLKPLNEEVTAYTVKIEVDRNSDYYSRDGYIDVKSNDGSNFSYRINLKQEANPIPDNAAEIQIHYMEPVTAAAANYMDSVYVNNVYYNPDNDGGTYLATYDGLPRKEIGRYIITKPGISNIKFFRKGVLVYDRDIHLKSGKQNIVVYNLNKDPLIFENEYPYWGDGIFDSDTMCKVNFVNLLFETPSIPYSGKIQYQANHQGEDTWENVGNPISFGEATGLQIIKIHPEASPLYYQRINFRIVTETGQLLEKWNGSSMTSYSEYWTEYNKRVYIHFLRGVRSSYPQCCVTQWTLSK